MDPIAVQKDWQTNVFEVFAKNSRLIISLFHIGYWLGLVFLVGFSFLETQEQWYPLIYKLGRFLGRASLVLLGIVVLPGILGRFRVEIRLTRIITLLRRQLGIAVFLLAIAHYVLVRLVPTLIGIFKLEIPYPTLYENLGAVALFVMFWMFITSNNLSQKKLGKWWKFLHRFVYVAIWALVLHTGLQKISIWTLGIAIVGVLEVISWIYYLFSKKKMTQVGKVSDQGD